MPTDFLSVLELLERSQVRHVLVGGLAVLVHGVDRLTAGCSPTPAFAAAGNRTRVCLS
ncbi:MAG: hypothetical protein JSR95_06230 [Proteobacteria bacterium]|nr:hypothetical protein [Pseudomonadota bacterium]